MDIVYDILHNIYPYTFNTPDYMRDECNLRKNIVTFFFQGHGSSRGQAALYAGPEGVSVINGNETFHAECIYAPRLLHNIWVYEELCDVNYYPYNPIMWIGKLLYHVNNNYLYIRGIPSHTTRITYWNVGGSYDIMQYIYHFREMLKQVPPNKKIVLFGTSRGAVTTFNALSYLTRLEQDRIALIILEAPFDTLHHALHCSTSLFPNLQLQLLSLFTLYKPDQVAPVLTVESFPLHIPVAFITSEADRRIPKHCTENIINRLIERGHNLVYHCKLHNARHELFSLDNSDDQKTYYDFVETLYNNHTNDPIP